ncbi:MAG: hypothetical protein KA712_08875 [Myxococcales bacterium]|nr:hypothetical protein [Myxococcales bacterium]
MSSTRVNTKALQISYRLWLCSGWPGAGLNVAYTARPFPTEPKAATIA